jgi:rod shape determining protein RodA
MSIFQPAIAERHARLDRLQIVAIVCLMMAGAAFVYSATMVGESAFAESWLSQSWFRQIVWYCVGGGAAAAVCVIDYRSLSRFSYVIYWGAILLLLAVLIPGIGSMRFGARRWIDLGFFQFQPSEFAKLATIFALGHFLSRPVDELRAPRNLFKALGLMLLPFVMIMEEPDLGSAIVLVPTAMVMLFVAGTPPKYLLRLMAAAGALGALFLIDVLFAPPNWQIKLEDYQRRRLLVYFGVDYKTPPGASKADQDRMRQQQFDDSHNVRQALISVGSGGLSGKGYREGTQNALGYLPRSVAHNDFIFSVIAEEKGFIGSVVVLTLYGVVLLTGIRIAGQARDRLGKLLAAGVVTLLFSHVFINIGMNIRLMPVTGVPLPLLSYGGSSVLSSLIAIGILQNVYMYRKTY